jgi:hypothetical protein
MKSKEQSFLEEAYERVKGGVVISEAIVDDRIKEKSPFFIKNVGWFMRVSGDIFQKLGERVSMSREVFLRKYSGKSIVPVVKSRGEFERQMGYSY